MTTVDILPSRDNKHSHICYHYITEIQELKDQVNCLQRAFANLRKDLFHFSTEHTGNKDSFWIHAKMEKSE